MKRIMTTTELDGTKTKVVFKLASMNDQVTVVSIDCPKKGRHEVKYETPWVRANYMKNGRLTRYGWRGLVWDADIYLMAV